MTHIGRPLVDCHCGDIIIDERPILRRVPRTTRYKQMGTEIVRGVVIAEAAPCNHWRITVRFPEGDRVRDTQWVIIEVA